MDEEIVKTRQEEIQKIKSILEAQERILLAFPYGRQVMDARWRQTDEPQFCDNLVITNKRVLIIPREWFVGKKTYIYIPFLYISGVEIKEQVMGTTLLIKANNPGGTPEYMLNNCPKKEGEQAADFLQKMKGKLLCDNCLKQIKEEFLYCPYCKHLLKKICSGCGKELEGEWVICPFCGK